MMKKQERGFTILELMIATLVFSTILISITMGVMYFTRSYYKGVYAAATQDAARAISEQITQAIQFSGSAPTLGNQNKTPTSYICAGATEFVYSLGMKYDGSTTGMFAAPMSSGSCTDPASIVAGKKQLLSKNMRLAGLSISSTDSVYTVDVTVAYGDNDLLCVTGNCASSTVLTDSSVASNSLKLACKPMAGSEFCAVSHLQTTVERRLQ